MTDLPISPPLARALAARDYTELTAVQEGVLSYEAQDRDLLVSAQTGSGKTVAYGLALAATLLGEAERLGQASEPLALIIAPTRELALQVQRELAWLYAEAGAKIVACVGGMDPKRERTLLDEGAHIVVGTPGRLRDHVERRALDLSSLLAVVLDEADEMLDLGFRDDLEFILKTAPESRRTLLFSATLPTGIVTLAKRFQQHAHRIEAAAGERGHADIEYRVMRVLPNEIEHGIVNLLRHIDPPTAIVFCNTRNAVRHLHATLMERGFSVVILSGELGQHERNQALQALRDGRARICVATDVAARGIDLPNLGLVIHAELPSDPEVLQHRSGRTGRAGRKGVSVLVVPPSRQRRADSLLANAGLIAQWGGPPSAEDIRALDRQRLMQDPLFTEAPADEDVKMAEALLAEKSPEIIAAAFAKLYRARHPEPEDVSDPGAARPVRSPQDRDYGPGARDKDRGPRARPTGGMVRFKLEAGRKNRADPKWILPLICRRGKVTRDDVGAIRIFDTHTEFEVIETVADQFIAQARRGNEEDVPITPIGERMDRNERPAPRPRADDRPRGYEGKPPARSNRGKPASGYGDKPRYDDRPRYEDRPRFEDKPRADAKPKFDAKPRFDDKPRFEGKASAKPPARAGVKPTAAAPKKTAAPKKKWKPDRE